MGCLGSSEFTFGWAHVEAQTPWLGPLRRPTTQRTRVSLKALVWGYGGVDYVDSGLSGFSYKKGVCKFLLGKISRLGPHPRINQIP